MTDVERIEAIERDALADLYAASPRDLAAAFGMECRRMRDGLLVINRRLDNIVFNRLIGLGVSEPATSDALDEACAAFKQAGVRNWIVQSAPGAAALTTLLTERGFVARPRVWAKFVHRGRAPPGSTGFLVREIHTRDAPAFAGVVARAFALPSAAEPWIAALVDRPQWHAFGAFDAETLVAGGAFFISGASSWLGFGATDKAYRSRGAQTALLAARIRASAELGADLITTETGVPLEGEPGPSFKNIQQAGFAVAYERPNFELH